MRNARYACTACKFIGVPFRPQGRDPTLGLDCIGLAIQVYGIPATEVRRDYRLRGSHLEELIEGLKRHFRKVRADGAQTGDLLVFQLAPEQTHLGIATSRGVVHADARIGAVVELPGWSHWPIAGVFRKKRA